jgi:hypothetical protein
MNRLRFLLPRLALMAGVLLVLFFVLEIVWRVWVFPATGRTLRSPAEASPYPDVGYVFRPNSVIREKGWTFRLNSHGLREEEFPLVRPAGTFRILVLGDSMVASEGLQLDKPFVAVLEKGLNKALPGRTFHTINAGHAGYNLVQELGYLRHYGLKFQPNLVIVAYHYNDPLPAYPISGVDPATGKIKWWVPIKNFLKFRSVFFGDVFQRIQAWSMGRPELKPDAVNLSERAFPDMFRTLYDPTGPHWKTVTGAMAGFRALSDESGIPLLFLILPMNQEGGYEEPYLSYYRQVENELKKNNFPFLNLVDALKGRPVKSLWVDDVDAHFGVLAHQIVGDAIRDYLLAHPRLLEPAS